MPTKGDIAASRARRLMRSVVETERSRALEKHGALKGGMERWAHHLAEECAEAVVEMEMVDAHRTSEARRNMLITELAQVAQLAESMIITLIQNKQFKGEETWKEGMGKFSSSKEDNGVVRPKVLSRIN